MAQQTRAVEVLIRKLGPEASEDDNLNGSSIIQDMLEIKEFYQMICKKTNL